MDEKHATRKYNAQDIKRITQDYAEIGIDVLVILKMGEDVFKKELGKVNEFFKHEAGAPGGRNTYCQCHQCGYALRVKLNLTPEGKELRDEWGFVAVFYLMAIICGSLFVFVLGPFGILVCAGLALIYWGLYNLMLKATETVEFTKTLPSKAAAALVETQRQGWQYGKKFLRTAGITMVLVIFLKKVWEWLQSKRTRDVEAVKEAQKSYEVICAVLGGYLMMSGNGMSISSTLKQLSNWWMAWSSMGAGMAHMFGSDAAEMFGAVDAGITRLGRTAPRRRRPQMFGEVKETKEEKSKREAYEKLFRDYEPDDPNDQDSESSEIQSDELGFDQKFDEDEEELNTDDAINVQRPVLQLSWIHRLKAYWSRGSKQDYSRNFRVTDTLGTKPEVSLDKERKLWQKRIRDYLVEMKTIVLQGRTQWCCGVSGSVEDFIKHVSVKHTSGDLTDVQQAAICVQNVWGPQSFDWVNEPSLTFGIFYYAPPRKDLRTLKISEDWEADINLLKSTTFGKFISMRDENPKTFVIVLLFAAIVVGAALHLLRNWYRNKITTPPKDDKGEWQGKWNRQLQAIGGYQFIAYDDLAIFKRSVYPVFSDAAGQNFFCQSTVMEDGLYTITHSDPNQATSMFMRYEDSMTKKMTMIELKPAEMEMVAGSKEGFLLRSDIPKMMGAVPRLKWATKGAVQAKQQIFTVMSYPKLVFGHGNVEVFSDSECAGTAPTTYGFCGGPWVTPDISVVFIHFWGETAPGNRIRNGGLRPGMWCDGVVKLESKENMCTHHVSCEHYLSASKGPCNNLCNGHHCKHVDKCVPIAPKKRELEAICNRFFRNGTCPDGDACRFGHMTQADVLAEHNSKHTKGLCYSFATFGNCRKGDTCLFIHEEYGKKRQARNGASWNRRRKIQESGLDDNVVDDDIRSADEFDAWGQRMIDDYGVEDESPEPDEDEQWMAVNDGPTNTKMRKLQSWEDKELEAFVKDAEALVDTPCPYRVMSGNCKFRSRGKCPFNHDFRVTAEMKERVRLKLRRKKLPCQFGSKCNNANCGFMHPAKRFIPSDNPTRWVKKTREDSGNG
jgi:hypothetical protein